MIINESDPMMHDMMHEEAREGGVLSVMSIDLLLTGAEIHFL